MAWSQWSPLTTCLRSGLKQNSQTPATKGLCSQHPSAEPPGDQWGWMKKNFSEDRAMLHLPTSAWFPHLYKIRCNEQMFKKSTTKQPSQALFLSFLFVFYHTQKPMTYNFKRGYI
jgi:hypothetical protein